MNNYFQTAKSFLDPRQVGYLIFYVTNRCNFRCKFCFYYAEIEKGRKPNELTLDEINLIFETSDKFKEVLSRPIKKVPSLRHITIANVFLENSTRTKLSFELDQKRLSADIVNFSYSISSVKKGESLLDTIKNLLRGLFFKFFEICIC